MSGALALRSYALIDHRHWFLRSNNNLYCMQVTYLAVGCSHHVNISKILAVWKRCNETRLSNVILSCHFVLSFIREARNFNSVCCNCCYGTTGASLTARRAACAHTYVTCVCIPDTTGRGHATRTRSTCFVRELRHPNLPQQKARRLAPSAPVPAVQRLGPHLDGPGTQGVPISHRVAAIPPEQWRLSGAQPAAPAPRAPRPGQLLGPRLGTTGTPGRRHMPRACPGSPGGCAQRPPREAREPSCGLHRRGSRSSLSCC